MKHSLLFIIYAFNAMADQITYQMHDGQNVSINFSQTKVAFSSGNTSGVGQPNCSNHQPPAGLLPQIMSYEQFSGNSFGYSTSSTFSYFLPKTKYATFPVFSPPLGTLRKNSFEVPVATYTPSEYTISLSQCPGDFNVVDESVGRGRCVISGGMTPVIRWAVKSNPTEIDLLLKCILDPGKQYYLNIIHSVVEPYEQTACSDNSGCGVLFTELLDN